MKQGIQFFIITVLIIRGQLKAIEVSPVGQRTVAHEMLQIGNLYTPVVKKAADTKPVFKLSA